MTHIPRLWFSHQNEAIAMMDFLMNEARAPIRASRIYDLQIPEPVDNLKEVWITNTIRRLESAAWNSRILAREELTRAEECVKRLVSFWESRGVTVVLKDSRGTS